MVDITPKINTDNEQRILSYLMHHLDKVIEYKSIHFLYPIHNVLFKGLELLYKNNDVFDLETLFAVVKDLPISIDIEFEIVKTIYDAFESECPNIETHKRLLENDYIKNFVSKRFLEDIITQIHKKGYLPVDELKVSTQSLLNNLNNISINNKLLTAKALEEDHLDVLEKRDSGIIKKRSLGFRNLDERLTSPAAPGQITLVFAWTGFGKSLFTKNIENNLIKKGTCVLTISTEMLEENDMDRYLCIQKGLKINLLKQKNMNPRFKGLARKGLNELGKYKNYLYFNENEEDLDLGMLDALIYQSKEKFKDEGVLPDDDYMVVIIDLLSDLEDFMKETKDDITLGMKILHKMAKKHKIHFIPVVQSNENKFRQGKSLFTKPEECDFFKLGREDIYGGTAYAKKSRVILSLMRPLELKKLFFPDQMELWNTMEDVMKVHCIKQTEGSLFTVDMLFTDTLRIVPIIKNDGDCL